MLCCYVSLYDVLPLQFFLHLLQVSKKPLAIFGNQWFFEELVDGLAYFLSQLQSRLADLPLMEVQGLAPLIFLDAYWVEMARHRLSPRGLSRQESFLYGASPRPVRLTVGVDALATVYDGGDEVAITVFHPQPLTLNLVKFLTVEQRAHRREHLLQPSELVLFQRGSGVAIVAASTLASADVAHEAATENLCADDLAVNLYHHGKMTASGVSEPGGLLVF